MERKEIGFLIGKIVGTLAVIIFSIFFGTMGALMSMGSNIKFIGWACFLSPLCFIPLIWVKNIKRVLVFVIIVVCGLWAVVGFGCVKKIHDESVKVASVNINVEEYLPFEKDSKVVSLNKESSLILTDNLPKVDGAAAVFPVYSAFVRAVYPEKAGILEENDYEPKAFNYFNTPRGYQALAERKTDIFFGAYPSKEQIEYAKSQGTEFVFTPIGKEAFVFFVQSKSDVDNLSVEDIKKIYTKEITNWRDLGFRPCPIIPFQRNSGSGSQTTFLKFMGDVKPADPPTEEVSDLMVGVTRRVADYRNSKGAIGFSFRYYLETIINRKDIKMISVNGVAPTTENIKSDKYPIVGNLYAVTWKGNPNPNVKKLIDWVCSEEGQYLIEKTGYVPYY